MHFVNMLTVFEQADKMREIYHYSLADAAVCDAPRLMRWRANEPAAYALVCFSRTAAH